MNPWLWVCSLRALPRIVETPAPVRHLVARRCQSGSSSSSTPSSTAPRYAATEATGKTPGVVVVSNGKPINVKEYKLLMSSRKKGNESLNSIKEKRPTSETAPYNDGYSYDHGIWGSNGQFYIHKFMTNNNAANSSSKYFKYGTNSNNLADGRSGDGTEDEETLKDILTRHRNHNSEYDEWAEFALENSKEEDKNQPQLQQLKRQQQQKMLREQREMQKHKQKPDESWIRQSQMEEENDLNQERPTSGMSLRFRHNSEFDEWAMFAAEQDLLPKMQKELKEKKEEESWKHYSERVGEREALFGKADMADGNERTQGKPSSPKWDFLQGVDPTQKRGFSTLASVSPFFATSAPFLCGGVGGLGGALRFDGVGRIDFRRLSTDSRSGGALDTVIGRICQKPKEVFYFVKASAMNVNKNNVMNENDNRQKIAPDPSLDDVVKVIIDPRAQLNTAPRPMVHVKTPDLIPAKQYRNVHYVMEPVEKKKLLGLKDPKDEEDVHWRWLGPFIIAFLLGLWCLLPFIIGRKPYRYGPKTPKPKAQSEGLTGRPFDTPLPKRADEIPRPEIHMGRPQKDYLTSWSDIEKRWNRPQGTQLRSTLGPAAAAATAAATLREKEKEAEKKGSSSGGSDKKQKDSTVHLRGEAGHATGNAGLTQYEPMEYGAEWDGKVKMRRLAPKPLGEGACKEKKKK